jgi:hypothetical protein
VFDGVEMGGLLTWIRPGCDCMHLLLAEITMCMSSCMHVAHHTQPHTGQDHLVFMWYALCLWLGYLLVAMGVLGSIYMWVYVRSA